MVYKYLPPATFHIALEVFNDYFQKVKYHQRCSLTFKYTFGILNYPKQFKARVLLILLYKWLLNGIANSPLKN